MQSFRMRIAKVPLLALLVFTVFACGKSPTQDRDGELHALAEKQNWKEIQARVEMYQKNGEHGAILDYWRGVACLQQDEDVPAQRWLDQAVAADSSLAFKVADQYRVAAERDVNNEWNGRGGHRLMRAYLLDHKPEMGKLEVDVAKLLFDGKKFKEAIPVLQDLLDRRGESVISKQRWRYLLGRSYEECGLTEAGLAEYRKYWADWGDEPESVWRDRVRYRCGVILLAQAKDQRERGLPSAALKLLEELRSMHCEVDQQAEAYYEEGQCYEALGQPQEALKSYRSCMDLPQNAGGNGRDEARKRVAALRTSGVH